jgi:nucleotidyltransferase substrate binding protein (TIGR01987 family)
LGVSSEELEKALNSLQDAIRLYAQNGNSSLEQKAFRDASIQRFEYSIELCWKVAMKVLGSQTNAAKPAVREMGRANLIENVSEWLEYIEARNNTSHSYDENVAAKVFAAIQKFVPDAEILLKNLQALPK